MTDLVHRGDADRWGGWDWRPPRRGASFRTCSYCGSIHPADLAALTGWRADWADMKYGWPHKAYITGIPPTDPDMLFCIMGGSLRPGESLPERSGDQYVLVKDLTDEQRAICVADGMTYSATNEREGAYVGFGTRREVFAKLYSIHLADPEIDASARQRIEALSGIAFEFTDDGKVRWRRPHPSDPVALHPGNGA